MQLNIKFQSFKFKVLKNFKHFAVIVIKLSFHLCVMKHVMYARYYRNILQLSTINYAPFTLFIQLLCPSITYELFD